MKMKQFTFLQEGVTGLYQRPKSFWSCSHMNCCLQKYITHQFVYFIYIIHIKTSRNIQELQESIKYIKSYQQKQNCIFG